MFAGATKYEKNMTNFAKRSCVWLKIVFGDDGTAMQTSLTLVFQSPSSSHAKHEGSVSLDLLKGREFGV